MGRSVGIASLTTSLDLWWELRGRVDMRDAECLRCEKVDYGGAVQKGGRENSPQTELSFLYLNII